MSPIELLKLVVKELKQLDGPFAIAGGLAASLYRKNPRLTNDVDIALYFDSNETAKNRARAILKKSGLEPVLGWIASEEKLDSSVALVIGKQGQSEYESTVDFLLPVFPWLEKAVRRAQNNVIDFEFAKLPVLPPEDLIIAKCFALSLEENRFTDLDDIKTILEADNQLDVAYLALELERLEVPFPRALKKEAPPQLRRLVAKN